MIWSHRQGSFPAWSHFASRRLSYIYRHCLRSTTTGGKCYPRPWQFDFSAFAADHRFFAISIPISFATITSSQSEPVSDSPRSLQTDAVCIVGAWEHVMLCSHRLTIYKLLQTWRCWLQTDQPMLYYTISEYSLVLNHHPGLAINDRVSFIGTGNTYIFL